MKNTCNGWGIATGLLRAFLPETLLMWGPPTSPRPSHKRGTGSSLEMVALVVGWVVTLLRVRSTP